MHLTICKICVEKSSRIWILSSKNMLILILIFPHISMEMVVKYISTSHVWVLVLSCWAQHVGLRFYPCQSIGEKLNLILLICISYNALDWAFFMFKSHLYFLFCELHIPSPQVFADRLLIFYIDLYGSSIYFEKQPYIFYKLQNFPQVVVCLLF